MPGRADKNKSAGHMAYAVFQQYLLVRKKKFRKNLIFRKIFLILRKYQFIYLNIQFSSKNFLAVSSYASFMLHCAKFYAV